MLFLVVAIAPWLLLLYALLVLAGGGLGYLKARSKPSLISGLISGTALLVAFATVFQNYATGMALALGLAIALLIVFGIRFRKTGKWMPAGVMALVSLGMALWFAIALLA